MGCNAIVHVISFGCIMKESNVDDKICSYLSSLVMTSGSVLYVFPGFVNKVLSAVPLTIFSRSLPRRRMLGQPRRF